MLSITDQYNRSFSALRVSLLDRCNFSCVYCVDENAQRHKKNNEGPDNGEMKSLILQLHGLLQLNTIRLTGGEPLLFKGIAALIRELKENGSPAIKITTNGVRLPEMATVLADAGVDEINVSLDAVDPVMFEGMTGSKQLHRVMAGIDAAISAGLPVKLNAVIMRGYNEDQLLPLLKFADEKKIVVRFLELMKMGYLHHRQPVSIFSAHDMLTEISSTGPLMPLSRSTGATARYWKTAAGQVFGIIANDSIPFCSDCNRLRLDSKGKIYGCLSDPHGFNIRGLDDHQIRVVLQQAIQQKQPLRFSGSATSMQAIGG